MPLRGAGFIPPAHLPFTGLRGLKQHQGLHPHTYYPSFHEPGIVILVHMFERRGRRGTTFRLEAEVPFFRRLGGGWW